MTKTWTASIALIACGLSCVRANAQQEPAGEPDMFSIEAYDSRGPGGNKISGFDTNTSYHPRGDLDSVIYLMPQTRRVHIIPNPTLPAQHFPKITFTWHAAGGDSSQSVLILLGTGVPENDDALRAAPPPENRIDAYLNVIDAAAADDVNAPPNTNRTRGLNSEFYGRAITGQPYVRKIWYWHANEASGNIIAEDAPPLGSIINIGGLNSILTIKKGHLQQLTIRGSVGQNHDISVLNGYLQSCQISGNLAATVYVPKGSISTLTVGGAITVPNHPVFGYEGILARDGINVLTANSISNTNIIANKAGSGNIGLIRTTQTFSGSTAKGANLQGSGSSTFGVLVQGTSSPTNSNMNFRGDATEPFILSGGLAAGTTVNISGSLAGENASVTLPADGLKGQIIINSKEGMPANTPDGVWNGQVTVGGQPLTGYPYYTIPSNQLGGGAVGLAPFHLYNVDCTPASEGYPAVGNPPVVLDSDLRGTVTTRPAQPIRLAFYGPVKSKATGVGPVVAPLTVGVVVPGSNNQYIIDVTSRFTFTVDGLNGNTTKNRFVTLASSAANHFLPGLYVVRQNPASGTGARLVSNVDVAAQPEVAEFAYYFRVVRDCNNNGVPDSDSTELELYDLDHNGVVDNCMIDGIAINDLCLADLYFNLEDPYDGLCVVNDDDFQIFAIAYENLIDCRGDLNGDGLTDDADFSLFAVAYNQLQCEPGSCFTSLAESMLRCGY